MKRGIARDVRGYRYFRQGGWLSSEIKDVVSTGEVEGALSGLRWTKVMRTPISEALIR